MTAPAIALLEHVPGTCSEHGTELVTHKRAGARWWSRVDPPTVCPGDRHTPYDRERCLWCGRALEGDTTGAVFSPKRAYCRRRGDMCRIDAHRARRRGLEAPRAIGRLA